MVREMGQSAVAVVKIEQMACCVSTMLLWRTDACPMCYSNLAEEENMPFIEPDHWVIKVSME